MKLHENETVELKEKYTPDIKKEIVAFANTSGGEIYLGVSDDGEVIGIDNVDFVSQQIANSIRDSIRPDISMDTHIELLQENALHYIRISINPGTKKPYYLSDKGLKPSGVYIRSGTTSAPASEDAIRRMIKATDGESFESNRSLIQNLTFNTLETEMALRNMEFSDIQKKNLGIITRDQIYTNLGLLVSDQCKHSIKYASFQGKDKSIFIDRIELGGSVFSQLNEAYKIIDFRNRKSATFEGLYRKDQRDYPEAAVREALLNAIVHRDYAFSGSILINMYSDRLEFISLGGLVPGLSLEAALLGASQPRNEKLANLFYRMELIEAYGTGLTKIMDSYEEYHLKPSLDAVEGAFRVILPNINESKTKTKEERYSPVMELLENKESISRSEVEEALGSGSTHAIKILGEMLDKNLLEKVGRGKLTKYIAK